MVKLNLEEKMDIVDEETLKMSMLQDILHEAMSYSEDYNYSVTNYIYLLELINNSLKKIRDLL